MLDQNRQSLAWETESFRERQSVALTLRWPAVQTFSFAISGDIAMRTARHYLLCGITICLVISVGHVWAQSQFRMEGVVTDAETQLPVAKTTARVLITTEADPSQRIRSALTDTEGRYTIDLQAGHGWAWHPVPPPGYYVTNTNLTESFATTEQHPVFTKNYQVRRGVPIEFLVQSPDSLTTFPKTFVTLSQQQARDGRHGFIQLDEQATGTITMPQLSGRYDISCGDEQRMLVVPEAMTVDYEEGFDPQKVLPDIKNQHDGTVLVRDTNHRTATLTHCGVQVREGQMIVVIPVDRVRSADESTRLQGRVVDVQANGIQGANITLAFYSEGGSASSQFTTTTDSQGEFSLDAPLLLADQKLSLIVTREGFGGVDTKPMKFTADEKGIMQVEPITLKPGCSVRVHVVGPDGTPLHGAVVEPHNNYASRQRIARTGPDGESVLTDLAAGMQRLSVQFGPLNHSTLFPLAPGENELVVVNLRVKSASPRELPERKPAIAVGAVAPEWKISEWTDGKTRKLSDYRGKIVVLDFWGSWCGPCLQAIPAKQELQERYQDREVVFLGIHTAGIDMPQVKQMLKFQNWDTLVGLDAGDEIATGETGQRYGIFGSPTFIVINRKGMVAFNSSAPPQNQALIMKQMETLAESAGIPWPIDKDTSDEAEIMKRVTQLQIIAYSRVIDEALKTPAE